MKLITYRLCHTVRCPAKGVDVLVVGVNNVDVSMNVTHCVNVIPTVRLVPEHAAEQLPIVAVATCFLSAVGI